MPTNQDHCFPFIARFVIPSLLFLSVSLLILHLLEYEILPGVLVTKTNNNQLNKKESSPIESSSTEKYLRSTLDKFQKSYDDMKIRTNDTFILLTERLSNLETSLTAVKAENKALKNFQKKGAAVTSAATSTSTSTAAATTTTTAAASATAAKNPSVATAPTVSCENIPKKLTAMMKPEEQQLLKSYIKPTTRYFEWGSGGSTDTYSRLTQNTVVSIENYRQWCNLVSSVPYVKCRQKQGTLIYKCIVPYPTKDAGYPVDPKHNGDFDEYINAIVDYPNFDVVLVDARWRVACAMKTLDFIRDDTVVFIHDANAKRQYYNVLFKWYEEIGRAASLVAMRRKKGVTRPSKE